LRWAMSTEMGVLVVLVLVLDAQTVVNGA